MDCGLGGFIRIIESDGNATCESKSADAGLLDGLDGTQFLRSDADGSSSGRLTITGGDGATLADGTGKLQLGAAGAVNLGLDGKGLQARNSSVGSALGLNAAGGDVAIHGEAAGTEFVVKHDGRVGIGTMSPVADLDVRGAVVFNEDGAPDADFRVEGDVEPNLFFVDASTDLIGLGTNTPGQRLSVVGGVNVDHTDLNSGTISNTLRFGGPASGEGVGSKRTAGGNQFGLDLYAGSAARLSIMNGGNVGIGTTSPGAKLDVRGGATFNEDGADADFRVEGDTNPNLLYVDATTDRVGIGTSAPQTSLDVRGGAIINNDGLNADFRVEGDTDPNLLFTDASVDRVGVGTGAPGAKFDLASTGQAPLLRVRNTASPTNSGQQAQIDLGFTDTRRIILGSSSDSGNDPKTNGFNAIWSVGAPFTLIAQNATILATNGTNLGVGTTSATAKLDVDGGLRLRSLAPGTCGAATAGTLQYVAGGPGVADTAKMCLKSSSDTYSWITVAVG